ncbi:MAG: YicC family protein [Gammaproteobacteria bacterium]|nr:YicC family protein [Gammaproteobacteria bacterium]MBT8134780.1 YicC family protein [Gammaproteobacteria bacterium]NNJ49124.1 YicC family protein [Gammaproteobacteria bacterium]
MTKSMTAFARIQQSLDEGELVWEIRSVNQRFLEVYFKMPEDFRASETKFREILQKRLKRGKVECFLRFNVAAQHAESLTVNLQRAKQLVKACHEINNLLHQPSEVDPIELLQWPGVAQEAALDMKQVISASETGLIEALDELVANREREGARMKELILNRCEAIQQIVDDTREKMPEIQARYQQKIHQRLEQINVEVNQDRLEQELVYLAQKMDVDEELDRLDSHLKEMAEVLARDEAVGRRLDFLMQELNREANTLGSKSADISSTNASVELKVLIEQMREQIQNIE